MKAEKERNEQTLANLRAEREGELKSLQEERERGEEVSLSPMLRKRAEPMGLLGRSFKKTWHRVCLQTPKLMVLFRSNNPNLIYIILFYF